MTRPDPAALHLLTRSRPDPAAPRLPTRYRLARMLHLAALLYLALMGWSRLILALGDWALLAELKLTPGPGYLAAGGALWGLLGFAAAALLYTPRSWARAAVFAAGAVFAASYWADRLLLARVPQVQANWPFALFMTLTLLVFSASLLYLLDQWEKQHGRRRRT